MKNIIDPYLTIVSPNVKYDKKDFTDFKFQQVEVSMGDFGKKTAFVEEKTYAAFLQAKKELEEIGMVINLNSAGRSLLAQAYARVEAGAIGLKNTKSVKKAIEKVKDETAKVSHSEHHTGLAIDISVKIAEQGVKIPDKIKKLHPDAKENYLNFLTRRSIMEKNGFILRYAEGTQEKTGVKKPEGWHWRYVGPEHSIRIAKLRKMINQEVTLEEYVKLLQSNFSADTEENLLQQFADDLIGNQNTIK